MLTSPDRYRSTRVRSVRARDTRTAWEGASVPAVVALFWLISLVRVVGALLRHEVFGAEATLALTAVLALPFVLFGRRGNGPALANDDTPPLS